MKRAAIATFAVLAVSAAPAQAAPGYTVHVGPLTVHGYTMTVDASTGILDVMFRRAAPGVRQTHQYSFERHIRLTSRFDLRRGRLTADLGRFGSVDLRFGRTGAIHRTGPGKGCFGSDPRIRSGRLTGTFRLVLDTTFFGTVTASRLPARLIRIPDDIHCTGLNPPHPVVPGPLTLYAGAPGGTQLTVTRLGDGRSRQVMTVDVQDPPSEHVLTAVGPAGSFTGSQDAATVLGAAPGFTGTLTYAATRRDSEFATSGTLGGDYTGQFDSIGPQTIVGQAATVSGL